MGRSRGVTLADVAAQAGVSVGTVSKALNGRGQLSDDTRQRVEAAALSLGFRPNQLARSLATGRSYIVGVLTTDSYGRFTIPILTGAEDTFGPGEISMLLAESRGDPIREQHYIQTLLGRKVDGIIVAGRSSNPRESISGKIRVPAVYALSPSKDPDDICVVPDDTGGARRAVEHLIGTGKRSIAVVAGTRHSVASTHRVAGVREAIKGTDAVFVGGDALYGEWTERWGYEAAGRLLDGPPVDGIFCASDQLARGVLDCLRESGVSVPGQIGVVGVDNWNVMVEAARPSITSIDLNLREVGRKAAELLVRRISGESIAGGIEYVDCLLVTRQST